MRLYGFALLPDDDTKKRLIAFQKVHTEIKGPRLSMVQNLPHTSILQCPYYENFDAQQVLRRYSSTPIFTGMFGALYYQPNGWIFADVMKTNELCILQNELLKESESYIDAKSIAIDVNMNAYCGGQKSNYLKYGYRYIGEEFIPHITLGRTHSAQHITAELVADFKNAFFGTTFIYDKLVYYEAGEFGALHKIVRSTPLIKGGGGA